MSRFAQMGNDLYTGKRSIDFVGRQKTWYAVSALLLGLAVVGLFGRELNLGIEFRGGSEFRVSQVPSLANYEAKAKEAVGALAAEGDVTVTTVGDNAVRVQTEEFDDSESEQVKNSLARAFDVTPDKITSSLIGPSWGQSVSNQALKGLIWFLVLVSLVLALYFRTWKMSLAALVALAHDLVITVGIYALAGFEVTPASVIGFLTILGYSLYDTVVVFDKVRENTAQAQANGRRSYSQAANLAVNQTLVRSINTSVVALLPVTAILVVGFTLLGPGTLLDLSLALFVGIATGTYSSIFIATPLLADLREREPGMKDLARRAARYQTSRAQQPGTQRLPDGSIVGDEPPMTPESSVDREAAESAPAGPRERVSTASRATSALQDSPTGAPTSSRGSASSRPTGTDEGLSTAQQGSHTTKDSRVSDSLGTDSSGTDSSDADSSGADSSGATTATGRTVHKYAQAGPRNQPRRRPKSKR